MSDPASAKLHHIPGYGAVCHPWITQWAVYDHPLDDPEHFVARRWTIYVGGKRPLILPTQDTIRAIDIIPIREVLVAQFGMDLRMPRLPADDPKIAEVWM